MKDWTTADELTFIEDLGKQQHKTTNFVFNSTCEVIQEVPESRIDYLKRYILAAEERKVWNSIDKLSAIFFAKSELREEEKRARKKNRTN